MVKSENLISARPRNEKKGGNERMASKREKEFMNFHFNIIYAAAVFLVLFAKT